MNVLFLSDSCIAAMSVIPVSPDTGLSFLLIPTKDSSIFSLVVSGTGHLQKSFRPEESCWCTSSPIRRPRDLYSIMLSFLVSYYKCFEYLQKIVSILSMMTDVWVLCVHNAQKCLCRSSL